MTLRSRKFHASELFQQPNNLTVSIGPGLGKVEPEDNRQAGMMAHHRQRDRDLAIILFAELAAILPGYADRMPAFLWDQVSSTIQARIGARFSILGSP